MKENDKTESEIHELFDATLILKGIHACIEVVGGVLLYFVSAANIVASVNFFVQDEIKEDPHDVIANYFLHAAQSFGGSTQSFASLYLVSHGIINALVVVALWKKKLWAYPASLVVLAAFIVYQLYLLSFGYSLWLIIFTILDVIIMLLVWHEYGILKKQKKARNQ